QRTAQGGGLHLLGCALGVAAGLRAVHHSTAGELRGADGALAGSSGALLPPRFATTAADLAAGFGRGVTAPRRGELGHDDLVDQWHIRLDVEDFYRQLGATGFLTIGADDVNGCRCHVLMPP